MEKKEIINNCKCLEASFDIDKWTFSVTELDGLRKLPKCGHLGPTTLGPKTVVLYYGNDQDDQIYLDKMKKFLYEKTLSHKKELEQQFKLMEKVLKDLT